jgi:phenylacetate-CoA ligase
VQACVDLGVTAYVGLPSYLKALFEKAEEQGATLAIERAFVTAEPLPPSLRSWLTERVPVVRQGYGTAEAGCLGFEGDQLNGLHVPADALVQICDLTTGEAVDDGREGQVVVTVFEVGAPVVRFGTGDLSAWATDEAEGPTPRIRGWLGRVGDAVKVRGMFLHPRQVAAAMDQIDGIEAYRFVIDRVDHRDVLRCEVVPAAGTDGEDLSATVHERIQHQLRFNAAVELVTTVPDGEVISDVRSWD